MRDLFFPPLCLACGTKCRTKILCLECWGLCELPDPLEHCRHCFEPVEDEDLCIQCRSKQILNVPRAYVFDRDSPARNLGVHCELAMAGFAILQWVQLEWPIFDLIVPMPDSDSIQIAQGFSSLIERPMIKAFNFFDELKPDRLEEHRIVLLFDVCNPIERLKKISNALTKTLPKRIYLLSLFGGYE